MDLVGSQTWDWDLLDSLRQTAIHQQALLTTFITSHLPMGTLDLPTVPLAIPTAQRTRLLEWPTMTCTDPVPARLLVPAAAQRTVAALEA